MKATGSQEGGSDDAATGTASASRSTATEVVTPVQNKSRREGPIRAGGPSRLRYTKTRASSERAKDSTAEPQSPSREGKRSNTMAFTPRFKEKIVTLTSLHDNLVPRLQEMPHLARDHAALADLLTQARELEGRQDLINGELRGANRPRLDLDRQGRDLRNRISAALRGTLGLDNVDLVKYGIQPRPREVRRKRLTKAERAEQLAREAARAKAELEAEKAVQAAAEAQLRASV